jgi:divalent metal cation (Fe/Co/Zn/Cd) transporter
MLEYATLAWNVVGTVVIITAAMRAGSAALAGFGLDSLIEIFASTIVVWQLKGVNQSHEHTALRLIGVAFILLALYVLGQSAYVLITGQRPGTPPSGIAWLVATVVVMLLLAWGKLTVGRRLGNSVLQTEGRVTLVDAYLAAAVLVGVVPNGWLSWWWADPLAGLIIVYYGVREGREAWHHSAELPSWGGPQRRAGEAGNDGG